MQKSKSPKMKKNGQNFDFCLKFRFLFKISIFVQNFDFCPKFLFLSKILIFVQNFDFCSKDRFLSEILISVQKFRFCPKFWFLSKTSVFVQNFDFRFFLLAKLRSNPKHILPRRTSRYSASYFKLWV